MHFLVWLIIPLFSFLLQSYPRFFNRYFGIDVWTRLIEINHVKKAKHRIPGKIVKGFIINGFFDYPIAFPWIFSFFPKKFLFDFQGFIAPIFDSLQNVLVFFVASFIFHSTSASLIAQLIYTLTPILPIENSYLTPRSMGYLNFTLALLPILLYEIYHQPLFLIFGFSFTVLLFLTHRFALQAFVFISIFFTFFDKSALFIFNLLFAFLTVVIITQGYYLRVLKGHLANIYFWVVNKDYRFAHQIFGNKKKVNKDWVASIYSLLSIFSPVFMLAINCWIISAGLYAYLFLTKQIIPNLLLIQLSAWIIFFYIFGVLVLKIKQLIPIGEGQRYLEMATLPAAILSTYIFLYYFSRLKTISIIILSTTLSCNLILILFIQIKGIIKDKNRSLTDNLKKAYDFINTRPGKIRILCLPHGITTMTIYNTKAEVLVNADNPGLLKIKDFFPVLKKPLGNILKMFKINYILLQENFAKVKDLKLKKYKIVFRSNDVVLLKV